MYQYTVVVFMFLSGGCIIQDGMNLLDQPESSEKAILPKSPSNLATNGKSAVEMIVEILIGISEAITKAYVRFVDGFASLLQKSPPPQPLSTTAKIKKKAENVASYLKSKTNKGKDGSTDLWSNLMAEIERGLDSMWVKTTELKELFFILISENEILSVVWTLMTGQEYIIFYAGVVLPLILPQSTPIMGQLFWTLIACAQYIIGRRRTQIQRHLGWAENVGVSGGEEMAESEATGSVATLDDGVLEEEDGLEKQTESAESEAPTLDDQENATPTPFLHVEAPVSAKSAPAVNEEQQQQARVDAVFRNCNSETECERRERIREESRQNTRRTKLQPFGVHDIRRVAPPIDSTQAVRNAIEEVERRRQAKLAAAKLLDEDDEYANFHSDAEGVTLLTENDELEGEEDSNKENVPIKGLGDAEDVIERTCKAGEDPRRQILHTEDGDSVPTHDRDQRERVITRIRGLQTDLQEIQALSSFMGKTEDLD